MYKRQLVDSGADIHIERLPTGEQELQEMRDRRLICDCGSEPVEYKHLDPWRYSIDRPAESELPVMEVVALTHAKVSVEVDGEREDHWFEIQPDMWPYVAGCSRLTDLVQWEAPAELWSGHANRRHLKFMRFFAELSNAESLRAEQRQRSAR